MSKIRSHSGRYPFDISITLDKICKFNLEKYAPTKEQLEYTIMHNFVFANNKKVFEMVNGVPENHVYTDYRLSRVQNSMLRCDFFRSRGLTLDKLYSKAAEEIIKEYSNGLGPKSLPYIKAYQDILRAEVNQQNG